MRPLINGYGDAFSRANKKIEVLTGIERSGKRPRKPVTRCLVGRKKVKMR